VQELGKDGGMGFAARGALPLVVLVLHPVGHPREARGQKRVHDREEEDRGRYEVERFE
jgi:hypothetical protein